MNYSTIPFDTLRFANGLKEVGVPDKQAERQAELMAETINNEFATKRDMKEIDLKIERVRYEMRILGALITIGFVALGFLIKA